MENMNKSTIKILISLVFLVLGNGVEAETLNPLYGRAPYAILDPNFSCTAYTASTQGIGDYGIAFLWNTFGNDFTCLNQELINTRVKLVEAHLINGPCLRNQNCGNYEILYGYTVDSLKHALQIDDPDLKQKIQIAAQNLADYLLPKLGTDVACYINPILETNLQPKGTEKIQTWIAPIFNGRCNFVWNPEGSDPGVPIPGTTVSEGHGQFPTFANNDCIADPDGSVISSVEDWKKYFLANKNCVAVFGWTENDNCVVPNQAWIDPRARSCAVTSQFLNVQQGIIAAKNSGTASH